jgi:hypothetical protein
VTEVKMAVGVGQSAGNEERLHSRGAMCTKTSLDAKYFCTFCCLSAEMSGISPQTPPGLVCQP